MKGEGNTEFLTKYLPPFFLCKIVTLKFGIVGYNAYLYIIVVRDRGRTPSVMLGIPPS